MYLYFKLHTFRIINHHFENYILQSNNKNAKEHLKKGKLI